MTSSTPFTIFMEKKKRRSSTTVTNDFPVVKAAAWAWYQHGSGSEGKSIREFDVTNRQHRHHNQAFRPSRYKLEARKKIKEYSKNQESSSSSSQMIPSPVHSEENSLLDAYEVERISEQLDCLLVPSSNKFYTKLFHTREFDRQKSSNSTTSSSSSNIGFSNISAIRKNKNFLKRLWMGHSITCGTREDVDPRALERIKPRPPQFPVP